MIEPRNKSNLKPATFPKDYVTLIRESFLDNFNDSLEPDDHISVAGAIYPRELIISITLSGSIRRLSCIASIDLNTKLHNLDYHVHLLIEATGSYFDEYFTSDRTLSPILDWTKYELGDDLVYMKTSSVNDDLERKANDLLKGSLN